MRRPLTKPKWLEGWRFASNAQSSTGIKTDVHYVDVSPSLRAVWQPSIALLTLRNGDNMTPEQAIDRLAEVIKPGTLSCLWCCAAMRLALVDIASNPTFDRDIAFEESAIADEVRMLAADFPGANICQEHREMMARLESEAAGVTP